MIKASKEIDPTTEPAPDPHHPSPVPDEREPPTAPHLPGIQEPPDMNSPIKVNALERNSQMAANLFTTIPLLF